MQCGVVFVYRECMLGSCCKRHLMLSPDLARLVVWVLQEHNELHSITVSVAEEDEVSIHKAAQAMARAMAFQDGAICFIAGARRVVLRCTIEDCILQTLPHAGLFVLLCQCQTSRMPSQLHNGAHPIHKQAPHV